jgi:hypothetical protein
MAHSKECKKITSALLIPPRMLLVICGIISTLKVLRAIADYALESVHPSSRVFSLCDLNSIKPKVTSGAAFTPVDSAIISRHRIHDIHVFTLTVWASHSSSSSNVFSGPFL